MAEPKQPSCPMCEKLAEELSEQKARVKELARMLGGVEITKKALDHAREMMAGQRG